MVFSPQDKNPNQMEPFFRRNVKQQQKRGSMKNSVRTTKKIREDRSMLAIQEKQTKEGAVP